MAKSQLLEEKEARTKIEQKLAELSATVMPLLLERFQKNNPKEKILKTLAILFLDIKGFSKFTDQQRSDALSILRSLARPMLREGGAMYINTWGDAIVAGFSQFDQGVLSAVKFLAHLDVEGIVARIGMASGLVRVAQNELIDRDDIDDKRLTWQLVSSPWPRPAKF